MKCTGVHENDCSARGHARQNWTYSTEFATLSDDRFEGLLTILTRTVPMVNRAASRPTTYVPSVVDGTRRRTRESPGAILGSPWDAEP